MTARTHDVIAFSSLLTVGILNPPGAMNVTTLGAVLVGNIVGSLIPDMDQASNRLWDLLPLGDAVGKIFRRIFMKHRTLTHSLLGVYLIYHVLNFLLHRILNPGFVNIDYVFISMMIGYVSHLAADLLTKDGLPLLFPLKWNVGFPPLSFLRITTGSWVEKFVVFPGAVAYIFWFIGRNQTAVLNILKALS